MKTKAAARISGCRRSWPRRFSLGFALLVPLLVPFGSAQAQPVERVPLFFPAIEPTPPGKRLPPSLGQSAFLDIVQNAPLVAQTEELLAEVNPKYRRLPPPGMAEARWLLRHTEGVAALLQPVDTHMPGPLGQRWQRELQDNSGLQDVFTPAIMAAIAEAPVVLTCRYDQGPALPADLQSNMWSLKLKNVALAFWTAPAPAALAPEALRSFGGQADAMHPLIAIGPPIAACPETLGAALEIMASQFPGQVPAAALPPPGDPRLAATETDAENAEPVMPREPADAILARLVGMSLAVTNINASGRTTEREYVVVDRLDPDGPAARAGFRSGDYLWMVGWSHHQTIDSFAEALAAVEPRMAAVLSRRAMGRSDHQAALVVFADEPPGKMVEMPRNAAVRGRTVLVYKGWQRLSVREEDWCAPHVEVVEALDIGADELVPTSSGSGLRDAFALIKADCRQAETISILRISSRLDAPIHVLTGALDVDQQLRREGIDGLRPGETVAETRRIALAEAPACDRLAAHPRDPMRRYGLEGVASFDEDKLEQAFQACLAATDADPDDVVALYQLGRVLHAGGLFEDALTALRTAADSGHGGASDLLGEMHLLGEGVEPDADAARDFLQAARDAGFHPSPPPDPAAIDLTGVALSSGVREVYDLGGSMYIAMDPEYKASGARVSSAYLDAEDRAYLVRMAVEVATLCGSGPSLEALKTARASGLEDVRDVDHALHLYGQLLPSFRQRILARYPTAPYATEGSQVSVGALVQRYDCLSPQLRQFAMNAFDMALE